MSGVSNRGIVRHLLGKPDGTLIRWRCALLGHKWEVCNETCCNGLHEWCDRCLTIAYAPCADPRLDERA